MHSVSKILFLSKKSSFEKKNVYLNFCAKIDKIFWVYNWKGQKGFLAKLTKYFGKSKSLKIGQNCEFFLAKLTKYFESFFVNFGLRFCDMKNSNFSYNLGSKIQDF